METVNLFNIIPDNFFSPLAHKSRAVYWDCLCRIFAITSVQLSFGVERNVLVNELEFYFDSSMSAELDEEEGDAIGRTSRDKANFVLRKLETYGWITVETDYSYIQRVNFNDYAVQIIKTLLGLSGKKQPEYQGYIYTIYSLARSARENPGIGLLQIVENTDLLLTGLKSLNANIRRYIDELTRHITVSEILDVLLVDYYSNIVDKAYHRLVTSDNVSKFRPEIIERLESCAKSRSYIKTASAEISSIREVSEEEAEEQVLGMLHEVIDAFRRMDEILEDINKKNTKYQSAAINRAKFLLSSSDDVRGQLKDILTTLGEVINTQALDFNSTYELEELDGLIKLFSWEYLDINSLYSPVESKKEFIPERMEVRKVDEALRAAKRAKMLERMERILSPEKIDAYVLKMLGDREVMLASQLPLDEGDTFIKLIYIRLYGQRRSMQYTIKLGQSTYSSGFSFRDFTISKKR